MRAPSQEGPKRFFSWSALRSIRPERRTVALRFGRIDRSISGPIGFGVVGPKQVTQRGLPVHPNITLSRLTLELNPRLGRAYSRPRGDRQARAASSDRAPRTASVIVPGSGTDCTATKPCAMAFESSKKPTTVPEPLIPAARVPKPRRGRRES